jgi:hypothetical protein
MGGFAMNTMLFVAVAAAFPMMALALSVPFYVAAWLRSARRPGALELSPALATA